MARRDNSDPTGIGNTLNWAWAWPANRRVLYNRASCDRQGKPFNPERVLIKWNGKQWGGADVPDVAVGLDPEVINPFIMNPEGVARLFARKGMAEGPFPTHYEAFDNPLGYNPMYPNNKLAVISPVIRILETAKGTQGDPKDYPHVGTTYRLTEHFHYWTKHVQLNNIVQPEQFVEIGEALGKELGIETGQKVKVSSKRGFVKAVAVVTKRIKPMKIDGRTIHHVGVPIHWGFSTTGRKGYLANNLTASVGDGNSLTPESKTFLVKVEKI
jgi:formate dehydrogenase major subunit